MNYRSVICIALLTSLTAMPKMSRAAETEKLAPALALKLASTDEKEVDQALQTIRSLIDSEPTQAAAQMREVWMKPLMDSHRYDTAANLALAAICAAPSDTSTVVVLQTAQVNALLKAGRFDEALANAKSLFNVTTSDGTEKALALLAECLSAAHPNDPDLLTQLRDEQITGATTRPATRPTNNIVRQIKIDPKPYETAIARFDPGHYLIQTNERGALVGEANLLLLADRAKEARVLMLRVRATASDDQRYLADENVARTLKAEDGSVGRANAWLLNPPKEPAPGD